jgi:hypothetical protein
MTHSAAPAQNSSSDAKVRPEGGFGSRAGGGGERETTVGAIGVKVAVGGMGGIVGDGVCVAVGSSVGRAVGVRVEVGNGV